MNKSEHEPPTHLERTQGQHMTDGRQWEQHGSISWTEIKTLPRAPAGFVYARVDALRAFLTDQPDAYQQLDASGAGRPFIPYGQTTPCRCPYCENRPVKWAGNTITTTTFGVR